MLWPDGRCRRTRSLGADSVDPGSADRVYNPISTINNDGAGQG